jgi:hypothetical protein
MHPQRAKTAPSVRPRIASETPDQRQELLARLHEAAPEAFADGRLDTEKLKALVRVPNVRSWAVGVVDPPRSSTKVLPRECRLVCGYHFLPITKLLKLRHYWGKTADTPSASRPKSIQKTNFPIKRRSRPGSPTSTIALAGRAKCS